MKETDYIGKLVYDHVKQVEGMNAALEKRNSEQSAEITELRDRLEKVKARVVKKVSTIQGLHIMSFWDKDAAELFGLLGIEAEPEEKGEEDDDI